MARPVVLFVSAFLALITSGGLSGCSQDDPFRPKQPYDVIYAPLLHAVTAPESVATGDSVDIIVHIQGGGCHYPESIRSELVDPRHLRITVRARETVNAICLAYISYPAMVARTRLDEPGLWTIDVIGEDAASISIQVGVAPSRGGIHRLSIEPRSGAGGIPRFVDVQWQNPVPISDSVAIDPVGRGQYDIRCGLGMYRTLSMPNYSHFSFAPRPEDCRWTFHSRIFR